MASFELLERLRASGYRERVEVLEHQAPTELVTPVDIVRMDGLNRQVVVVPAGTAPPHWVQLTKQERQALVEPPQPLPDGWLVPGHCGFTPKDTLVGRWTIERAA